MADASARRLQLFSLLAGGIARIARSLALGFERRLSRSSLFLFARQLGGGLSCGFFLAAYLLGLGSLARQFGLGPLGGLRFALGAPLDHGRIIKTRLAAKLVQDILPRLLRRLLPVCEVRFLKSTHGTGLVAFIVCGEPIGLAGQVSASRKRRPARSGAVYSGARAEAIHYPLARATSCFGYVPKTSGGKSPVFYMTFPVRLL